jgi:isopentenyl phosphate kinase
MYLIKLGGSVITDKKELYKFKADVARRLAAEIKDSGKGFVLVHGAGSFGHIVADKFKLQDGFLKDEQLEGFAKVHGDVRQLDLKVLEILREEGINPVSLPPNGFMVCDNREITNFNPEIFFRCTDMGFTPVTFGDIVFDSKLGFCICSGDDLMLQLSMVFHPEKAVFVADVDGIFDSNPSVHEEAQLLDSVDQDDLETLKKHQKECPECQSPGGADATGGMLRKVEIMLQISQAGTETTILNGLEPSRLKRCLSGEEVIGTKVKAKRE